MTEAKKHFALTICDAGNELVAAECAALTGTRPDNDGFVRCTSIDGVGRAAYLRFGGVQLAQSPTLDALLGEIAGRQIQAEAFRVEIIMLPGGAAVHGFATMTAVADLIDGDPNLTAPERRFIVVSRRDGFYFGEIQQMADGVWKRHDEKPLRTSCSLPSRLCRAIVNLAVSPGNVVLNPCCGTGSFLLEAASMGAEIYGIDHNPKMVWMSRRNVSHFGYAALVEQQEVSAWERRGDVLLADLPYDRNCRTTEANVREILTASAHLAPRGVFVAEIDLTAWLHEAGYSSVTVYKVPKTPKFTRYVHCVEY